MSIIPPPLCFLVFCFTLCNIARGQAHEPIIVSELLRITPLTRSTYMHTCDRSNGLIYTSAHEAVIVSTPPSDTATLQLIRWVSDSLRKDIGACVADRWHPDAMGGLDVVHQFNIPSYASELTRQIAEAKGLPVPQHGFDTLTNKHSGLNLLT